MELDFNLDSWASGIILKFDERFGMNRQTNIHELAELLPALV